MTFSNIQDYLEVLYYISQLFLVGIAFFAALYAARQSKTFKIHEMLKYIESNDAREARFRVMNDIKPIMHTDWWADDENRDLFKAASDVAAVYDIVHIMLQKESKDIQIVFYHNWAGSITRTHDVLQDFLNYRRSFPKSERAYQGFSDLVHAVKPYVALANQEVGSEKSRTN